MAGYKVSNYAKDGANWDQFLETIEKQRKGFIAVNMTNYDNNSLPAIEAGGYVEVGGALYGFTGEEAATGVASDDDVNYLVFDPTPMTIAWTTTDPTWSADKNGYYDVGEAKRYLGGCYYDNPNYYEKWIYDDNRFKGKGINRDSASGRPVIDGIVETGAGAHELRPKVLEIGNWDMDASVNGSLDKEVAHGLGADWKKIRSISVIIRKDDDANYYRFADGPDLGPVDMVAEVNGFDDTTITLRHDGTNYDLTSFDTETGFNRGWVTIWYEV